MELLSSTMLRGFQLMCLAIFLVLVFFQIQAYFENKDSSTVGYRQFNNEERDLYPAVSLCLQSRDGGIFNKVNNEHPLRRRSPRELAVSLLLVILIFK